VSTTHSKAPETEPARNKGSIDLQVTTASRKMLSPTDGDLHVANTREDLNWKSASFCKAVEAAKHGFGTHENELTTFDGMREIMRSGSDFYGLSPGVYLNLVMAAHGPTETAG
jgi:hypothetical protein